MFYMLTVELEFIFYFVWLGGFQYKTIPLTVSLFYPFFCSKYYYFYTSILIFSQFLQKIFFSETIFSRSFSPFTLFFLFFFKLIITWGTVLKTDITRSEYFNYWFQTAFSHLSVLLPYFFFTYFLSPHQEDYEKRKKTYV